MAGSTRPAAATTGTASKAWQRTTDWLLPPLCLACQRGVAQADSLCAVCWREVRFIGQPLCERLGSPLPFGSGDAQVSAAALASPPDFDRARAAAHFMGPVRALVHQLKYQDRLEARALLAGWMNIAGRDLLADAQLLVPVPLYRQRLLWRRFNQAALLGLQLERLTGVPLATRALERRRNTPAQVGLTELQRRQNVRGAFKVASHRRIEVAGLRVVLLDDVITTGATVNAAARALRRAGAVRVDVLAVAMVTNLSRSLG